MLSGRHRGHGVRRLPWPQARPHPHRHPPCAPAARPPHLVPHAESAEEEFVFVVEGRPDVWIDGVLHRLNPGDSVAFPAGTGVCHTFLNNSREEVRLLVVGEKQKAENRVRYPLNAAFEQSTAYGWTDAPPRALGPHDGRARIE